MLAFNPDNGRTFRRQLTGPWEEPIKAALFPANESGAIFSIPASLLDDQAVGGTDNIELRTQDFVPDEGEN